MVGQQFTYHQVQCFDFDQLTGFIQSTDFGKARPIVLAGLSLPHHPEDTHLLRNDCGELKGKLNPCSITACPGWRRWTFSPSAYPAPRAGGLRWRIPDKHISSAPGSGGNARLCPRQRRKRSRPERSPVAAGASAQQRALALGRLLLRPWPRAARGLLRAGRCPTRDSCGTSSRSAGWHRPGIPRLRSSRPRPLPRPRGPPRPLPKPTSRPRSLTVSPRPPPSPAGSPTASPVPCPDLRRLPCPLPRPPRPRPTPTPTDAAAPIPCPDPRGRPHPLPGPSQSPPSPARSAVAVPASCPVPVLCMGPFLRCRVRHCRPEIAATGSWARPFFSPQEPSGEGLQGACLGKAETDCLGLC
ncbi:keratinocyte proline-rich protein-like [Hylobates moloch]|uniref:keratinocyte proline-rich protein-like n=1 Tax=Hylobates moloch TaxID=81572 RepID=UPI002674990F|nr:keratinocyte proline-rich protein-like [Hylobates moloch]